MGKINILLTRSTIQIDDILRHLLLFKNSYIRDIDSSVVEHLSRKHRALDSIHSTAKKNNNNKKTSTARQAW